MSDDTELQGEVEEVITSETPETSEEEVQESAPDSEQEHEEKPETPEVKDDDPEGVQKRINKIHWEKMEAIRKAEAVEKELQELRSKLPQDERPEIPPLPDPFDDDYQQKVQARDEALRKAAQYDAAKQYADYQRQQQAAQQQQEQQRRIAEKAQSYTERAGKLGIKPEELQSAGQMVGQYLQNQNVVEAILTDDHGPMITRYLANSPNDLAQLAQANDFQAGTLLASIKAKAAEMNKTKQPPPDPVEPLKGGGAKPDEGPEGAKFW